MTFLAILDCLTLGAGQPALFDLHQAASGPASSARFGRACGAGAFDVTVGALAAATPGVDALIVDANGSWMSPGFRARLAPEAQGRKRALTR
jgi:hypothetical protein